MSPDISGITSTDELRDALSAWATLEAEWHSLPDVKNRAIEEMDACDLVRIRHRERTLSLDLWAARAEVLRLQVVAKEEECDGVESALDRLNSHLEESSEYWRQVREAEAEAAQQHHLLKERADAYRARYQYLSGEATALKRELASLMALGFTGKGNK
jgi:hypothetical protein